MDKTEGTKSFVSSAVKRKSLQDTELEPSRKKTESCSPDSTNGSQLTSKSAQPLGPAPKLQFSLGSKSKSKSETPESKSPLAPVKLLLSSQKKEAPAAKPKVAPKLSSVFGDDDSDEEEMPAEAKMRMKNIGRETPTAAGPNSFGKSKLGFCDRNKMIEKEMLSLAKEDDS